MAEGVAAGHKASATRMLNEIDGLLAKEMSDVLKLSQLKLSLKEKLETLKLLGVEILELTKDDNLITEIEAGDSFMEGSMIEINKCMAPSAATTMLTSHSATHTHATTS